MPPCIWQALLRPLLRLHCWQHLPVLRQRAEEEAEWQGDGSGDEAWKAEQPGGQAEQQPHKHAYWDCHHGNKRAA